MTKRKLYHVTLVKSVAGKKTRHDFGGFKTLESADKAIAAYKDTGAAWLCFEIAPKGAR